MYFLRSRANRSISVPLILGGTSLIPPATAVNYVPWTLVAFIFQYIIRRRHFSWWAKYNCEQLRSYLMHQTLKTIEDVLSAALDSSIAIGSVLIFFWYVGPAQCASARGKLTQTISAWNTLTITSLASTPYKLGGEIRCT